MAKKRAKINITFVTLFTILSCFGLLMLTSASQVLGIDRFHDPYYYFKHQLFFGFMPGLIVLLLAVRIPLSFWKKIAFPMFICSLILLAFVFIPGLGFEHGGARRWIHIGAFSIQPSEFMKLTMILFFSAWLSSKKENVGHFGETFVPFMAYLGVIVCLIALQPDIGTLSVVIAIAIGIYWVAGIRISHFLLLIIIGVSSFLFLIQAAPYRLARISAFLNHENDRLGISYQINQSLIAVGSGGLFGAGLGQSKQKYQYLPEVAGDSIFAVIAEEMGFITTALFIILYLYFIIMGYEISAHSTDPFARYSAAGITTWFAYQSFINIGAMLNIMPLTGLPLPFISYGGSALIVSMAAVGILINISRGTPVLQK